ncbi:MAG: glucose-6-phosphate isomerase [Cyanobacteria bacterium P01_H01_bin.74]
MRPLIELNYENTHSNQLDSNKMGQANGLLLEKVFEDNQDRIASIVNDLYAKKNTPGQWCRWLTLGENTALKTQINDYVKTVAGQFDDMVVLGIGGSSLGGYALLRALIHPYWNQLPADKRNGCPRYHFIENVDADQMNGLLDILTPSRTLFIVISKSGSTAETMSAFMIAKAWLETHIAEEKAIAKHIVAITDAKQGLLRPLADQAGYQTFEVPDDVGGRFSVFSAVGLLPAALCGISIDEIQSGIQAIDQQLQLPDLSQNIAAQAALIQIQLYQQGKFMAVFMPYSFRLASVADWMVQLWAESLGKQKNLNGDDVFVGSTPIKAVGVTDQHSQVQLYNEGPFDKVFTFIEVASPTKDIAISDNQFTDTPDLTYLNGKPLSALMNAEFQSTRASLTRNQRPNMTITLPEVNAYYLAQLLYMLEVKTAIAGALLNIDPFNQPGVELAKQYTYALMGRSGYEHLIAEAQGRVAEDTQVMHVAI